MRQAVRGRRRSVAAFAAVVLCVLAAAAVGGATDGFVDPSTSEATVAAGGTLTVPETVHLDGAGAQQADVVIAVDTTQSMSGDILAAAKADAKVVVAQLADLPVRVQIVDLRDYGGTQFDENPDVVPFRTVRAFNSDVAPAVAIDSLELGDGGDLPEAYFGLFHSVATLDTWRANAKRFLVVLGDQTGHDPRQSAFNEFCPNSPVYDQGSLDPAGGIVATTDELVHEGIQLSFLTYHNDVDTPQQISVCHAGMADKTGGKNFESGDGATLGKFIDAQLGPVTDTVDVQAAVETVQTVGDVDPKTWITFGDLPDPAQVPPDGLDIPFTATIAPPADAPEGTYVVDLVITGNGGVERARQRLSFTVGTPLRGLELTVDQQTVPAGLRSVPFSAIPPDRLALAAGSTQQSAPIGSTPIGSTPIGSTPIGSTPIGSTPIGSTPIGSTPIGSTPIGSTGLLDAPIGSTPIGSTPLAHVLLSQIVLRHTTWDDVLCAPLKGKPLNALTLADVKADSCSRANFEALKLGDVDLSTSLLKGVRWTSLLLGDRPLADLPVPSGFASWQDAITAGGGDGGAVDPTTDSALGVDIAGKLGSTPIGSTPIGSTPIGSTPIGSTQLAALHVTSSKLATVKLSDLVPASSVVNCTVVDCTTATLGAAYAASAILPAVTLADPALQPGFAAAGITLNDVVTALLAASDFPWESLPVQGLQSVADTKQHAVYHLTTSVDCSLATGFAATVHLPAGFFPVAGTSTVSYGGGAEIAVADPTRVEKPADTYRWRPGCPDGFQGTTPVRLTFESYAGLTLGKQVSDASVSAGGFTISVQNQAPVTVLQNWESNDDPGTAPVVGPDALLVGHIASSGDQDFFRIPLSGLPRGTRVSVYLSHIPPKADFDLTISKDAQSYFSSPIGSTPIGSTPIEDTGLSFDNSNVALPSNTLQDVPIGSTPIGSTPIGSTSTNRGNADEAAGFVTQDETGFATIGVTGYNGSASDSSYVLRVKETLPPAVPANCDAPPFAFGSPSSFTPGALPTSLSSSTRTIFLLNRQRLSAMYSPTAVNQLVSSLTTLASRTEVGGRIVSIDGSQAVRDAYAAWDANRCSVKAANDVVAAIQSVLAGYKSAGLPNLRFVVLVGNDDSLPSFRAHDPVDLSPENNYANDLAFTTSGLTVNNPRYAAAADNDILTDNAFAGWTVHPWLDRSLLVPEVSTARLLERPADMIGQINRYLGVSGISAPQTAPGTLSTPSTLVTGYDFLADGATLVRANLNANFPGAVVTDVFGAHPTISSTWSAADLTSGFLQAGTPAAIASVNGHYNHYELEAGDGSLASSADATGALFARILFTMGCHGGYNLPNGNADPSSGQYLDWPELFSRRQAASLIANTGFGYGDSASVALSERMMSLYAKNLRLWPTIGEAWAATLGEYAQSAANTASVYDEKVIAESTFYGLPFWRFTTSPTTAPAPTPLPTTPDPLTGNPTATVTVAPSALAESTFADGTTQWSDGGNTAFGLYRPTQPLTSREVTSSQPARGLWVTALTTSDQTGRAPHLGYPTIDLAAHEPSPNVAPIFFPATPFSLTRSTVFGVRREFANVTGQFRPDPATPGRGTERLVTSATMRVLYSNSDDTTPPLISLVNVSTSGGVATISSRVSDDSGSVSQVAALVNDGAWHYVPLTQSTADPSLWTGTTPVAIEPEVVVEARDVANVGYSANKGSNFTSATSAPPVGPQIFIASPFGTYSQDQPVVAQYTCSSDPCTGSVAVGSPVDTSTPGVHTFTVTSTDADGHTVSLQRDYFVADLKLVLRITPSTVTAPAFVTAYASLTNAANVDRLVSLNATFLVNTSFSWTSPWITVKVPAGRTYAGSIPFLIPRGVPRGTYTVILRARDVTGLVTATATLTVQ